jgi:transketolase
MRNAFAAAVTELAARDERVVLLSGDIGNRLFDTFRARFPSRFYNCGVAEANMTSVAAGMALAGLRPFTYTITPFATTRAMEQIRVDVCYHRVPVTIVGTGSGLSYASLGPTHHSCEDIAMLRSLPNLTILCPADAAEVSTALDATRSIDGPVYLRLGKKGEPRLHDAPPVWTEGRGIVVREANDGVCLLGVGNAVPIALQAADLLAQSGISARVVSVHRIKPLDAELLEASFSSFDAVAVVEEHSVVGGYGSAVSEWITRGPRRRASFDAFGLPDRFLSDAGSQAYARERAGLTGERIAEQLRARLRAPA